MSKRAIEIFNDTNITPTSNSKSTLAKAFLIGRTDTTVALKAMLPYGAYITNTVVSNTTANPSNAATTAVVNFYAGNTSTLIATSDVKSTAAAGGASGLISLDTAAGINANGDLPIYANYVETGTASTSGGPWLMVVEYVV
jgi:hypothetical protein